MRSCQDLSNALVASYLNQNSISLGLVFGCVILFGYIITGQTNFRTTGSVFGMSCLENKQEKVPSRKDFWFSLALLSFVSVLQTLMTHRRHFFCFRSFQQIILMPQRSLYQIFCCGAFKGFAEPDLLIYFDTEVKIVLHQVN